MKFNWFCAKARLIARYSNAIYEFGLNAVEHCHKFVLTHSGEIEIVI